MFSGVSRVKIVPFLRFYKFRVFIPNWSSIISLGLLNRSNDVHKVRLGDSSWKGVWNQVMRWGGCGAGERLSPVVDVGSGIFNIWVLSSAISLTSYQKGFLLAAWHSLPPEHFAAPSYPSTQEDTCYWESWKLKLIAGIKRWILITQEYLFQEVQKGRLPAVLMLTRLSFNAEWLAQLFLPWVSTIIVSWCQSLTCARKQIFPWSVSSILSPVTCCSHSLSHCMSMWLCALFDRQ